MTSTEFATKVLWQHINEICDLIHQTQGIPCVWVSASQTPDSILTAEGWVRRAEIQFFEFLREIRRKIETLLRHPAWKSWLSKVPTGTLEDMALLCQEKGVYDASSVLIQHLLTREDALRD